MKKIFILVVTILFFCPVSFAYEEHMIMHPESEFKCYMANQKKWGVWMQGNCSNIRDKKGRIEEGNNRIKCKLVQDEEGNQIWYCHHWPSGSEAMHENFDACVARCCGCY